MATVRGRSSSAERRAAGLKTRNQILAFSNLLSDKAEFCIKWRIVDASVVRAGGEERVPWATWDGKVVGQDSRGWTVEYRMGGALQGKYNFPPDEVMGNGFVEIADLTIINAIPTLADLQKQVDSDDDEPRERKRPREDERVLQMLDTVIERVTGQEAIAKVVVAPRLKVVEQDDDWSILHINALVTQMLALPTHIPTSIGQLQASIDHTFLREGLSACREPTILRQYNDASRLYTGWFRDVASKPLMSKADWELGFDLLFAFAGSLVALKTGAEAGRDLTKSLKKQFAKGNVDVATAVSAALEKRIFRGRQTGDLSASKRQPERKEGSKTPTGAAGERKCKFCNPPTWHVGPWKFHLCKK